MIYLNPLTLLLVYILYVKTLNTPLHYPVMIIGVAFDIIVNLTWFTVIFLDVPRELLVTQRVERLKSAKGYRGKLANLICNLMNRIQSGHCV